MAGPLRLSWLPDAVTDLARLREFLRTHNPAAAERAAQRLLQAARNLQANPLIGRPVVEIDYPQFRDLFISFGQAGYWLRYTVTQDAVIIVKIWHGRENRI